MSLLRPALVMLFLFTAITGIAYPLAVTGIAQAVFPAQANGSPVSRNDVVVGSSLIGQNFDTPRYFHGRPSATAETPYNAAASSGSNLGPSAATLVEDVKARATAYGGTVPADLVTASGSGLDPDISPEAAEFQAARVAAARALPVDRVRALIAEQTRARDFVVLGQPRVNVLALNLSLDLLSP